MSEIDYVARIRDFARNGIAAPIDTIALCNDIDALRAELASVRSMFDVTRHRMCARLGVDKATSWSGLDEAVASSKARERAARVAGLREAIGMVEDAMDVADDMASMSIARLARNDIETRVANLEGATDGE